MGDTVLFWVLSRVLKYNLYESNLKNFNTAYDKRYKLYTCKYRISRRWLFTNVYQRSIFDYLSNFLNFINYKLTTCFIENTFLDRILFDNIGAVYNGLLYTSILGCVDKGQPQRN